MKSRYTNIRWETSCWERMLSVSSWEEKEEVEAFSAKGGKYLKICWFNVSGMFITVLKGTVAVFDWEWIYISKTPQTFFLYAFHSEAHCQLWWAILGQAKAVFFFHFHNDKVSKILKTEPWSSFRIPENNGSPHSRFTDWARLYMRVGIFFIPSRGTGRRAQKYKIYQW